MGAAVICDIRDTYGECDRLAIGGKLRVAYPIYLK
jgi:hypothetical protein